MNVEIYSRTNCGYCDRAKIRLQKHNPKIHMLDQDYTREDFFAKFPNAKTFHFLEGLDASRWYPQQGMELKHPCVGMLHDANW